MRRRFRGPVGVLTIVLVASLQTPAAAQMDAQAEPVVTGPLQSLGDGKKCRSTKYEEGGEVVARAKICLFLYAFDPEQEDDEEDDYGVMWAQTNVDTSGGWCAFRVDTEVYIPSEMPMYARLPKSQDVPKRKKVVWKMEVDAEGHAEETATVKKGLTVYPRSLRRSRGASADEGVDLVKVTWRGETARKLGFVSGFEVSWKEDDGPPDAVPFRVEYPIRQC